MIRGVRGATTVSDNDARHIEAAVHELLAAMERANDLRSEDVAAALFSVTPDITALYPARAARSYGWQHVPLLDLQEAPVQSGVERCIRVLVLWNTDRPIWAIRHVYLRGARDLRPDLTEALWEA
jgi:monofunctional chorismate mutase